MHQGYFAAHNCHQRMQELTFGTPAKYQNLKEVIPMIAIALGPDALAYADGGEVQYGKEIANTFFNDDVGLKSELTFPAYLCLQLRVFQKSVPLI